MPQNTNKKTDIKFFHIVVEGINREGIFEEENERKKYLTYLFEKSENKNLQIIAYCIMPKYAHILIYTENIKNISELMSKLNTKYAIYYNKTNDRIGYVFRNRYKAEEILTTSHLISCINYIHNNPIKAKMCNKKFEYKYSSYNAYINKNSLLNMNLILQILKENNVDINKVLQENYCEDEVCKFIEYEELKNKEKIKKSILEKLLREHNIKSIEEIITQKNYLKEIAIIMYIKYNFTQKEIAETLGVNRLKVHRILHEL